MSVIRQAREPIFHEIWELVEGFTWFWSQPKAPEIDAAGTYRGRRLSRKQLYLRMSQVHRKRPREWRALARTFCEMLTEDERQILARAMEHIAGLGTTGFFTFTGDTSDEIRLWQAFVFVWRVEVGDF